MKSNATKCRTVRTEVRRDGDIEYRYELTEREDRSVAGFGIPRMPGGRYKTIFDFPFSPV